jgi:hypothetical protein
MTSTDTRTDAHRYAETIADEVRGIAEGRLDDYDDVTGPYDALDRWLNELALDVEVTTRLGSGRITAVTVVRTVGGPYAAVTFTDRGDVEVVAAWGDRATVRVDGPGVPMIADAVLDYYAEVTA